MKIKYSDVTKKIKLSLKNLMKWDSEFIGIIVALILYHIFQIVLYFYDETSRLISLDYLGTSFIGAIYILIADYVAIQGVKRRFKPLYRYYRQVKELETEEGISRKTQFNLDLLDSFKVEKSHRLIRIWAFQRTYFIYFFLTLVVFLLLNL